MNADTARAILAVRQAKREYNSIPAGSIRLEDELKSVMAALTNLAHYVMTEHAAFSDERLQAIADGSAAKAEAARCAYCGSKLTAGECRVCGGGA